MAGYKIYISNVGSYIPIYENWEVIFDKTNKLHYSIDEEEKKELIIIVYLKKKILS